MPCTLCGLPLPKPPVSDAGHDFCCIGCREVYRAFGEDALIAEKVSPRNTAKRFRKRKAGAFFDEFIAGAMK